MLPLFSSSSVENVPAEDMDADFVGYPSCGSICLPSATGGGRVGRSDAIAGGVANGSEATTTSLVPLLCRDAKVVGDVAMV